MRSVVVAVGANGEALAAALGRAGVGVRAVVPPEALPEALLDGADALVLEVTRSSLDADVVALCDRVGARIVPLCGDESGRRVAAAFGLPEALPLDVDADAVIRALSAPAPSFERARSSASARGVLAVWGPAGAPGRSTIAIELAVELARGGRRTGLVDADSHAPSLALLLGLAEEGPGFAAACRQADRGLLDVAELTRIAEPVPGAPGVEVLTGINRPGRWPELSERRVAAALAACRGWADHTVVDVAAPLERDEEIVSDLDGGPRRNAATIAALQAADAVVAVFAADPLGVARFVRAAPELRAVVGAVPVFAIANRVRPAAVGIDARGQVRRTVERFAGVRDVWFVPDDRRAADASRLASRPVALGSPRSALTQSVRRFVGEALLPPAAAAPGGRRAQRTGRGRARSPLAIGRAGAS
ncbi:P-loop NTPase [Microbacterium sp. X-17]|uniref:P-loop NTPase n=1 Tax=Microbacterium sp. X-17 TaxID=3144404 RepID=UPI0031F5807E